jgi:DNA-directed RNA polymerase subunit RPC12/RpoP
MKGGLNDYAIFVTKPFDYDAKPIKCGWIGHNRFRCGACKKGYFNVWTENKHDEECPECKYRVVIRWEG